MDRLPAIVALGPGALGVARELRGEAQRRGLGVPALALIGPLPAAPGTASSPGFSITHSVLDFSRVDLPPRPAPADPAELLPDELVAAAEPTRQALLGALATAPAWLPGAIERAPEAWLRSLGEPIRDAPVVARLLWPRVEADFATGVERLARSGSRRAFLIAHPGEALGSGSLLEALRVLRARLEPAAVVLLGRAAADLGLELLLAELEGERVPVVLLDSPLAALALLDLQRLPPARLALAERPYRGQPRHFTVARSNAVQVDAAAASWTLAWAATQAALERLLERRPPVAGPDAARDLLEQAPLPAFAQQARGALADLAARIKVAPFAPPAAGEEPAAARRRLDRELGRRIEELADRETRLLAEVREWLEGGKLSLLARNQQSGFAGLLREAVCDTLARLGIAGAERLLQDLRVKLLRPGEPRVQLRGKVADLDQKRLSFSVATRAGPVSLLTLLGRKDRDALAQASLALSDYARLLGDLLRLKELDLLVSCSQELVERAVALVDARLGELAVLREAVQVAREAVAQVPPDAALEGLLGPELELARREPDRLLRRALGAGDLASCAGSAQQLLDGLWQGARSPFAAAALLERMQAPGRLLVADLESSRETWRQEALPVAFAPQRIVLLEAPTPALGRAAAADLPFVAEVAVEPAARGIRLTVLETGLPRLALGVAPGWPAREAAEYQALLAATLEARDLPGLAQAAAALARAEAARDVQTAEEVDVLLELLPISTTVAKSAEVADSETRVHYLEEARQRLLGWVERARAELVEPERGRALAAGGRWIEACERALQGARGRALLRLRLRTRRLGLAAASTQVEVEVASSGSVPAEAVSVALAPGEGFRVLGEGKVELGRLPAGSVSSASFQIRPQGPGWIDLLLVARWDDLVGRGNQAELNDRVELVAVRPGFRKIDQNPYIAGPPVRSEQMFFGRSEVFEFVRDNLKGRFQNNVLLLHGNRRTGKSSLLYQLERGTHAAPFVPVYLDLQGLGRLTTASFFAALGRKVARALAGHGGELLDPPARESLEAEDAFDRMNEFLDDIEHSAFPAPPLLIMIDEFEILEDKAREGKVAPELFGWLRAKMQHSDRLAFLLAGTHRLSELDPTLWAPLLSLCLYRHVSFLSEGETRELVTRPVEGELDFDDLAIEAILRLTAGHPYYVQLLCQLLVAGMNERARDNVVALDDIHDAAARLLEAGGGQFTYEWGASPRSASRVALAALAEAADSAAVWVDLPDLAARGGLPAEEAEAAARELLGRDLVLGSGGSYRIRMDLFRQWLRREKSVSRARAEASR